MRRRIIVRGVSLSVFSDFRRWICLWIKVWLIGQIMRLFVRLGKFFKS